MVCHATNKIDGWRNTSAVFYVSRVTLIAEGIRPVNRVVHYLIRARPLAKSPEPSYFKK